MTNARLMTADEAFNKAMNVYPGLYHAATLQEARCKFFDHTFNTIGNGYSGHSSFVAAFTVTPEDSRMIAGFPSKYVDGKPLYVGYMSAKPLFDNEEAALLDGRPNPMRPDPQSRLPGFYTAIEKDLHPNVQLWREARVEQAWVPYPNFQPGYSLLYTLECTQLDSSWLQAGLEYYQEAKAFFAGPNAHLYHAAWPQDPEKQRRLVSDYEKGFAPCIEGVVDEQEQWRVISKEYGLPYHGDTSAFIQERWAIEQQRIGAFIETTIAMLNDALALRASTPSP